jgi:hypothetical protein
VCIVSPPDRRSRCAMELLDECVGTREQQAGVATVFPTHEIGRSTVGTADLENLAVSVWLSSAVSLDDDPIPRLGVHDLLLHPPIHDLTRATVIRAGALVTTREDLRPNGGPPTLVHRFAAASRWDHDECDNDQRRAVAGERIPAQT